MQSRIAACFQDLRRRPLVVARLDGCLQEPPGLLTVVKDAAGHGADLVVLPTERVTQTVAVALDEAGVGWMAETSGASGFADAADRGATVVHWTGSGAPPALDVSAGSRPRVFAAHTDGLGPGDGLVVTPGDLASLSELATGQLGVVDLTGHTDRATLAALVTVALDRGAAAFIADAPRPVRRAAHVIRAVELAE